MRFVPDFLAAYPDIRLDVSLTECESICCPSAPTWRSVSVRSSIPLALPQARLGLARHQCGQRLWTAANLLRTRWIVRSHDVILASMLVGLLIGATI
jgi:hypothetical protein